MKPKTLEAWVRCVMLEFNVTAFNGNIKDGELYDIRQLPCVKTIQGFVDKLQRSASLYPNLCNATVSVDSDDFVVVPNELPSANRDYITSNNSHPWWGSISGGSGYEDYYTRRTLYSRD